MLILSRKMGQAIVITTPAGEEIRITPTIVREGQVHLGFEAPTSVVVDREEVHERKKASAPRPSTSAVSRGNKALTAALGALLPSPREQRETGEVVGAALAKVILA